MYLQSVTIEIFYNAMSNHSYKFTQAKPNEYTHIKIKIQLNKYCLNMQYIYMYVYTHQATYYCNSLFNCINFLLNEAFFLFCLNLLFLDFFTLSLFVCN